MKFGVTLPLLNNSLLTVRDLVVDAEAAGFHSALGYEFWRSPYSSALLAAAATSKIRVGTAIGAALSRTPFATANMAADIDEVSNGRTILGLGLGDPHYLHAFHDVPCDKPLSRMRDYIAAVRASWDFLATGKAKPFHSEHYSLPLAEQVPFGTRPMVRQRIPIYLAALRPRMMSVAGEVADGVIGAFWSPGYLKETVLPAISAGAARTGRRLDQIDVCQELIVSVSRDRSEAMRWAKIQVGFYTALPLLDGAVRDHGLEAEQARVRQALMEKGPTAIADACDDKLVEAFSITGTPDEVRRRMKAYEGLMTHVLCHTPYTPPMPGEETCKALRNILETFS